MNQGWRAYLSACSYALLVFILLTTVIFLNEKVAALDEVGNNGVMITVPSPFVYIFKSPGTLQEAGSVQESTSPYWWLDSGGKLIITGTEGETIQGSLPTADAWRKLYAKENPVDTDNGTHPQNLFRLVTKSSWGNASVQAQFYIAADNLSNSSNRNESNGLLLMTRYQNEGQSLYYAGIRVDGTAVIKKKIQESPGAFGTYYTMVQKQIFPGTYDASASVNATGTSANLLPHNEWVGLKSTTVTNVDGSVTITLYLQRNGGVWQELLSATDTGSNYGGTKPITSAAPAGIRTDFMDVEFKNFRIDGL